jgi:glycosyltransferase involved in cell wall biosynthesis
LKILHIITGLKTGGAEKQLFELVTNSPNFEHVIISLTTKDYYGELLQEKMLKVYEIKLSRWNFFKNLKLLSKTIKKENPEIVQTWMEHSNLIGGLVSYLSSFKNIIWCVRTSGEIIKDNYFYIPLIIINSITSYFLPKKIIFNSKNVMNSNYYFFYKNKEKMFIPNGINLNNKNKSIISGKKSKKVKIGVVARWGKEKGHKTLFKAIEKLPKNIKSQLIITLAGRDMNSKNIDLIKLIEKYQLENLITLLGFKKEIFPIIRKQDFIILPSYSEGFSNVLLESMFCGVPCIATDVGDSKFIINKFGWIVPPHESELLKNKIEEALNYLKDKNNWNALKSDCQSRVKTKFDLSITLNSYEEIWVKLK